jgi:hypothetical protein
MYSNRRRPRLYRGPTGQPLPSPILAPLAHRGWAAVGHTAPPDRHAGPAPLPHPSPPRGVDREPYPTPRRVAYEGCSIVIVPPFSFPPSSSLASTRRELRLPLLSFLDIVSAPADQTVAVTPPCHCSPLVSSAVPSSFAPFRPRLTSHVLSSCYRTHRRPPWPSELHRRPGTLSCQAIFSSPSSLAVSGENPTTPLCLAQPLLVPRGVSAGRATPRPPGKPRHSAAAR